MKSQDSSSKFNNLEKHIARIFTQKLNHISTINVFN